MSSQTAGKHIVRDDVRNEIVSLLPRLRRFALALTGSADQADDLVQEACTRALSRLDQWQDGTRLDSWMFKIAQNIWFDRIRARRARGEMVAVEDAGEIAGSDGRTVADSRLMWSAVREGISRLNPEQRAVIALVCIDGASYKEAASILEVPIGTIMSRLARARIALADFLEGKGAPTSLEDRRANFK